MKNKKGSVPVIALIIVIVAVSAGVFGYMFASKKQSPVIGNQQSEDGSKQSGNSQQKVCTMEAKQCPDGSYVGRTGPECEFAKCPATADVPVREGWKKYVNEKFGFEFMYPGNWNVSDLYDILTIYDVTHAKASREIEEKNQTPWTGIYYIRADIDCNSGREFLLNENTLKESISMNKGMVENGVIIEKVKNAYTINGIIPIRAYDYINGDSGQQTIAYWESNKLFCSSRPVIPSIEGLNDQQKQQRIAEWEKILATFKFIN